MSDIVAMLKKRQGGKAVEDYAHELGIRSATLYSYYSGKRNIGISVARRLARYFEDKQDIQMISALGAFVLGVKLPLKNSVDF